MPNTPPTPRELTGLGMTMAVLIVGGTLLGWFIDGKAHTSPIFIMVGLLLGIGAASRYMYVMYKKLMDSEDED